MVLLEEIKDGDEQKREEKYQSDEQQEATQ